MAAPPLSAPVEAEAVDICTLGTAAVSAIKEGREEEALQSLGLLITHDSSSALWPVMRSRVLLLRGELGAALEDTARALEIEPSHAEALVIRVRVHAAAGGAEAAALARAGAKQALASPQLTAKLRAEVEEALAALRAEEGNGGAASACSRQEAAEASGGMSTEQVCVLAARGARAWRDGNVEEAKAIFAELRQADRSSPLWSCLLARVHLTQGASTEALAVCEAALAQDARHAELLLIRARIHLQRDDRARAQADLERARAIGGLGQEACSELAEALAEVHGAAGSSAPVGGTREPPRAETVAGEPSAPPAGSPTADGAAACKQQASEASAALQAALESEEQGLFRQARRQCEEALRLQPDSPEVVLCLARMELANGRGAEASRLLRKDHPAVLKHKPSCAEGFSILAAAAEQSGDWDAAAADLERAAKFAKLYPGGGRVLLEVLLGRLARAQWRGGEQEAATTLAQHVLDSAPTQREACEVACAVLLDRNDSATALAVMLRCLIGHRNEPSRSSADLVYDVMRRCSVEELARVLAPNQDSLDTEQRTSIGEVIGYVGLIMKERSQVFDACKLYHKAAMLAPAHASLCLNLMHTYALRRDDLRALAWGARYFAQFVASVPSARLVCSWLRGDGDTEGGEDVVGIALEPGQFAGMTVFYDAIAIGFVITKLLYLAHPHLPVNAAPITAAASDALPAAADQADARQQALPPPWRQRFLDEDIKRETVGKQVKPLLDARWMKAQEDLATPTKEKAAEGSAEVEAHRRVLCGLCAVLNSSREGRQLHLTPVRNEHAYFACISDIMRLPPGPPATATSGPLGRLYVVGDSHVLPGAWRHVDVPAAEGQPSRYVLVPCLVTGAKLWHLQDSSTFYTKYAFWDRIASLPSGAPAMLILGEIDCREGVLRAVQKGRHASVEAALVALVELYIALLREVRRRLPRSPLFVHPVAQVLPETRMFTLAFNRLLLAATTRAALAKAEIQLLEFEPVLKGGEPALTTGALELSKLELLPELRLDGTHMNPSYVDSHLAPALRRAWPR